MTNRLLKRIANDFDAESAFINNRMDTYTDIIDQYKKDLMIIQELAASGLRICDKQHEDIMLQLISTYRMIDVLQDKFNDLLDLYHRISNMPEIRKMINHITQK